MTLKIKDPGSALTHFIAMILALGASSPLIIKAARTPGYTHVLPLAIFITSCMQPAPFIILWTFHQR